MSPSLLSAGRIALTAAVLVLALAACGRRGAPEPPPDPSVQTPQRQGTTAKRGAQGKPDSVPSGQTRPAIEGQTNAPGQAQVVDADDADAPEAEALVTSPNPTGRRRARSPYVIPKEPFILDPLL